MLAARLNAMPWLSVTYGIPTAGVIAELTAAAQTHSHPKQFLDFIAMLSPLLTAPTLGLVHGEINWANVRQRRDGTLVILNWDEAGHGATVLDAGYPLITVFLTEKLHFQRHQAQAFYQGYFGGTTRRRRTGSSFSCGFTSCLTLHALCQPGATVGACWLCGDPPHSSACRHFQQSATLLNDKAGFQQKPTLSLRSTNFADCPSAGRQIGRTAMGYSRPPLLSPTAVQYFAPGR